MIASKLNISTYEKEIVVSENPDEVFLYTPSIIKAYDGSLVVSYDMGGAIETSPHYAPFKYSSQKMICYIHIQRPNTSSFVQVAYLPMCHARLFSIKKRLYIIGHNGRAQIAYSDDCGLTWSTLHELTETNGWHASSCNIWKTNDRLYLCMERRKDQSILGWNVAGLAPHILSVGFDDDLTNPKSWRISNSFTFSDIFDNPKFNYFGLPFLAAGYKWPALTFIRKNKILKSSPMGWLEGNVIQITDKNHFWYDQNGKTFYIFLRCNTAGVGYASLLKVVEDENLEMYTELARVPSGEPLVFLPFPGGHNKFFILYDSSTTTYWMSSTQPENSMRKVEDIPEKLFGLPNNERHRLVLYFSRNCVDWIFAGVVSIGNREHHARNYPSMIIDNDDLIIISRAGNDQAKDSQYTNAIMLHRIKSFRNLIY